MINLIFFTSVLLGLILDIRDVIQFIKNGIEISKTKIVVNIVYYNLLLLIFIKMMVNAIV